MKSNTKVVLLITVAVLGAGVTGVLIDQWKNKEKPVVVAPAPIEQPKKEPKINIELYAHTTTRIEIGVSYNKGIPRREQVVFPKNWLEGEPPDSEYYEHSHTNGGSYMLDDMFRYIRVHYYERRPDRWYPIVIGQDTAWGKKVPCLPYCIPK